MYFPVGSHQLRHSTTLLRELRGLRSRALVYLTPRTTALQVYRDLTFFLAAGVRKFIGVPLTAALRQCRVDAGTGELEYECERLARTLHPAIPVDLSAPNWDFRLSAAERALADKSLNGLARWRPMLAVAPGAKIAAKNWGERRWVELLKSLQQRTPIVALVFVGALDDWPLCERLSQLWPGPSVNLCGELTPRESAAVLGRCALLVCQDSGPMHLAASQGTPCVALFGTYNKPRQWFPFGSDHEVIYDPEGIEHIRVVTVINAVMAAVGRRDKGRGLWQPSLPLSPGRIADDRARHL